ncbi:sensor histidine kinase [Streptomyces abikoensis]|uniref:sensor histidine kinase n=1 Tax=Streptomyces abikoensis TaxID=97398 RepID=UPI00227D8651|nr:sensor histidine kinase [Streptomyces abikoensis]
MISRVRKFRGHSKIQQIDMYMRGALYVCPWLFVVLEGLAMLGLAAGPDRRGLGLGAALLVVAIVQAAAGVGLLRRALDRYLGRETVLRARLVFSFVLLAVALCLLALIATRGSKELAQNVSTMLMGLAIAPLGALCLIVRKRVYWALCAAGSLVALVPFAVVGFPFPALVGMVFGGLFLTGWVMLLARVSGWMLSIMWEVDAAREVQARLAVAEERLRFSRDMHDVLGRNLAAIALKSELAVQLARRGSDAAVDQMAEAQRIAQESQRELREVVRGYREADLHTELAGARGILTAAGIECRIDARAADDLSPAVQSTLAWVVREATTNVLRHSDAGRCALRLRSGEGRAVLTVENDGVRVGSGDGSGSGGSGGAGGSGSGLAGLRERLAVLGGTLAYEHGGNGTFLLTARVGVDSGSEAGAGSAPPEGDVVADRRGGGEEAPVPPLPESGGKPPAPQGARRGAPPPPGEANARGEALGRVAGAGAAAPGNWGHLPAVAEGERAGVGHSSPAATAAADGTRE